MPNSISCAASFVRAFLSIGSHQKMEAESTSRYPPRDTILIPQTEKCQSTTYLSMLAYYGSGTTAPQTQSCVRAESPWRAVVPFWETWREPFSAIVRHHLPAPTALVGSSAFVRLVECLPSGFVSLRHLRSNRSFCFPLQRGRSSSEHRNQVV